MNRSLITAVALLLFSLQSIAQQKLSLSEAIERGLSQSYGVEIAEANTSIASELNNWGEAGAYPYIYFSLSGGVSAYTSSTTPAAQASVNVAWTLFNGFLVKTNKAILANNEELSQGSEMLTIENAIKSIISSYYYVIVLKESVLIEEDVYKLSMDRYKQVKIADEIGHSGTYELIQAESALLEDEKRLETAKKNYRNGVIEFNKVLSEENILTTWEFTDSLPTPSKDYSLATMEEKMLYDNTTLKNQYINQKARDLEIKQAQSGLYPSVALSVSGGGEYAHSSKSVVPGVTASLSLTYNLFNGGKSRRAVSIAKIYNNIEDIATDEMKLTLKTSLYQLFESYLTDQKLVEISKRDVELSKVNLELSKERYRNGTITSFNFRDVQLVYMASALGEISSKFDLAMTDLEMLQITGGILSK